MIGALLALGSLTGPVSDIFIDYVAKRMVKTMAGEAGNLALNAVKGLGMAFLGDSTPTQNATTSIEAQARSLINDALSATGTTLIDAKELEALLNIAAAAEGNSAMAKPLAAWKALKASNEAGKS
jgi:hypothetical protein